MCSSRASPSYAAQDVSFVISHGCCNRGVCWFHTGSGEAADDSPRHGNRRGGLGVRNVAVVVVICPVAKALQLIEVRSCRTHCCVSTIREPEPEIAVRLRAVRDRETEILEQPASDVEGSVIPATGRAPPIDFVWKGDPEFRLREKIVWRDHEAYSNPSRNTQTNGAGMAANNSRCHSS